MSPHAPYIQALIDHTATFEVIKNVEHTLWKPPAHMTKVSSPSASAKGKTPVKPKKPTTASTSSSEPLGRIASFMGKAQSAIMKAITFNCQQNHDVQKSLILSKNQLKQRLRTRGSPVSSDDSIPLAPSTSTFGFPPRDEYPEFFDGVVDADDIRQE